MWALHEGLRLQRKVNLSREGSKTRKKCGATKGTENSGWKPLGKMQKCLSEFLRRTTWHQLRCHQFINTLQFKPTVWGKNNSSHWPLTKTDRQTDRKTHTHTLTTSKSNKKNKEVNKPEIATHTCNLSDLEAETGGQLSLLILIVSLAGSGVNIEVSCWAHLWGIFIGLIIWSRRIYLKGGLHLLVTAQIKGHGNREWFASLSSLSLASSLLHCVRAHFFGILRYIGDSLVSWLTTTGFLDFLSATVGIAWPIQSL